MVHDAVNRTFYDAIKLAEKLNKIMLATCQYTWPTTKCKLKKGNIQLMATAILILFIACGLIGSLLPVIPGTAIIFAGAIIHAIMTGFEPIHPTFLSVMAILLLIANVGQYFITGFGAKKSGATKYGIIGACLGSTVGFFLPIPGGFFLGAFLGAFLFEVGLATSGFKQSIKAGTGAAIGTLLSFFFEFAVSLLMALLIAFQVAWI